MHPAGVHEREPAEVNDELAPTRCTSLGQIRVQPETESMSSSPTRQMRRTSSSGATWQRRNSEVSAGRPRFERHPTRAALLADVAVARVPSRSRGWDHDRRPVLLEPRPFSGPLPVNSVDLGGASPQGHVRMRSATRRSVDAGADSSSGLARARVRRRLDPRRPGVPKGMKYEGFDRQSLHLGVDGAQDLDVSSPRVEVRGAPLSSNAIRGRTAAKRRRRQAARRGRSRARSARTTRPPLPRAPGNVRWPRVRPRRRPRVRFATVRPRPSG